MNDEEFKKIIQCAMEEEMREIEEILAAIDADPVLREVQAPPELREKVFAQIREYEEQKRLEQLSEEDREYIRLGKIYRKRRKWNRVAVLIAAVVTVLALGTVSLGEDKNIFNALSRIFLEREQEVVDSDNIEPDVYNTEAEIYEKIEDTYGFSPVKMEYLPQNTGFLEAVYGEDIQGINIFYGMGDRANIIYIIRPNYREASFGTDIEDEKIQEYQMLVNDTEISVKEYRIIDSGENRWSVQFEHQDTQYLLRITDLEQEEVEKIINGLRIRE